MKRTLFVLVIILSIAFRLWASQPTWIHWDENYYINIFQNYVDRGELTPYMWRLGGETNIIAGSGTGYGIFILIGWMKLVGESLFGVRMLMVIAGLVTAWIYYLISMRWWGNQEAGVAALVFGLVNTTSFYSLVGRMDAIGVLSYSLLLLLHIAAVRQEKNWPHFLVGALAILTTEFHILGLLYVGALTLYYFYQLVLKVYKEKKLSLNNSSTYYFAGAGLFGILYIIVHILPGPKTYLLIAKMCTICKMGRLDTEFQRIMKLLSHRPVELLLLLLTLYIVIRRGRSYRHYLILLVGYLVSQIIISPPAHTQYFSHMIPMLALGFASVAQHLLSTKSTGQQDTLKIIFLVVSLFLLVFNPLPVVIEQFPYHPYENAYPIPDDSQIDYITEHIPTSTVVLTTADNFYPLKEYRNFLQYGSNLEYGLSIRQESKEQFWNRINPQVIFIRDLESKTDKSLRKYINRMDFVQVMPDLMVARELVPEN